MVTSIDWNLHTSECCEVKTLTDSGCKKYTVTKGGKEYNYRCFVTVNFDVLFQSFRNLDHSVFKRSRWFYLLQQMLTESCGMRELFGEWDTTSQPPTILRTSWQNCRYLTFCSRAPNRLPKDQGDAVTSSPCRAVPQSVQKSLFYSPPSKQENYRYFPFDFVVIVWENTRDLMSIASHRVWNSLWYPLDEFRSTNSSVVVR